MSRGQTTPPQEGRSQLSLEDLCRLVKQNRLGVTCHSGSVQPGGVFVILPPSAPGAKGGEAWLADALGAGAAYVVCDAGLAASVETNGKAALVPAQDIIAGLGLLARAAFCTDEKCPSVIGITGTNGKTTETYLLERLFEAAGKKVGVLGTVEYRWPGHREDAALTTPGCLVIHGKLAAMAAAGVDIAFMEVSSHALAQGRVAGIDFAGAMLTNVTQDHLDFHGDMENYFKAKRLLFLPPEKGGCPLGDKICAINSDDPYGRRLLADPGMRGENVFSYGFEDNPGFARHLKGRVLSMTPAGMHLEMEFQGRKWELDSKMVGSFNAMNLMAAQALCLGLGLDASLFSALSDFTGVRGRLERVENDKGLNVFVDYAHTPDALVNAIKGLRAAGFKRIVTVFGCGGNRDRAKRPLMGKAVADNSDVAVLTSDNPRHEEPEAIMADVMPGLAGCKEVHAIADRRSALARAVALIGPDDALLVAGKGHETYQIIKGAKIDFSDQDILKGLMQ